MEAAVRVLEDDPHFNAGKGAVFTEAGTNELDASIMDGKTLKAGAVASVKHIKNPISPRAHGHGKIAARDDGWRRCGSIRETKWVELVDQKYFYTEERWKALQRVKEEQRKAAALAERVADFRTRSSRNRRSSGA